MARMKIEFLHHWQRKHRSSLRDRMIAYLPRWAPWAARVPWLPNLRDALPGAAWASERWLGFAAQRTLPAWRSDTFLRTAPALPAGAPGRAGTNPEVVLLVDTFTNYFEPENAHAAQAVLAAAGYRVHIARATAGDAEPARPLCCGRTYLAAGLVDEARREAKRIVDALLPHAERGTAIVGLEPSCLLTLRDEFLVLGLGDAAQRIGAHAVLIEEFLAREHRRGNLQLPLAALPQSRALLHGHCHQKAFDAMDATQEVLRLVPYLAVEVVETSCCGMAGSFGYEARHHDVSMRMAELSLLPALRAAGPDTLIVADGTSCRHQISDGLRGDAKRTGDARVPLHVVRVLERALAAAARPS